MAKNNKTEKIVVRVTEQELETLKAIADIEDKSISDVIRGLIKYRSNYYSDDKNINQATSKRSKKYKVLEPDIDWLNM